MSRKRKDENKNGLVVLMPSLSTLCQTPNYTHREVPSLVHRHGQIPPTPTNMHEPAPACSLSSICTPTKHVHTQTHTNMTTKHASIPPLGTTHTPLLSLPRVKSQTVRLTSQLNKPHPSLLPGRIAPKLQCETTYLPFPLLFRFLLLLLLLPRTKKRETEKGNKAMAIRPRENSS